MLITFNGFCLAAFKIIEKIDSVFDKQILQDSGKKEIIDNGEWGLGTANSNKGNVLDLSKYAKYMTEDFYFAMANQGAGDSVQLS